METIGCPSSSRGRALSRRLLGVGATVAAMAAVGVALTAGSASAARNDPCSTAKAVLHSYMNEARFWIGAADRLAGTGNESMANRASDEADYYLGLAEGALVDM